MNLKSFHDIINLGSKKVSRYNRDITVEVDRDYLYINGNAMPTGLGETGQTLLSGDSGIVSWAYPDPVGATGVVGAQGETGLGNFVQKTDFDDGAHVPEIMWNFQDECFYGYVTGVNKWVQISSGSIGGSTGIMGVDGATGIQGETGVKGETGPAGAPQGETGSQGYTGAQGNTGMQG